MFMHTRHTYYLLVRYDLMGSFFSFALNSLNCLNCCKNIYEQFKCGEKDNKIII